MAVSTGPKIVTSGLIYDSDMYNTKKSWIGAPTTNLQSNPDMSSGTTGYSAYLNSPAIVTSYTVPTTLGTARNILQCATSSTLGGGGNYGGFSFSSPSLTPGTTYTVSFYARSLSGNMSFRYSNQTGSGDENNLSFNSTLNYDWQRFSVTATLDASKTTVYVYNRNISAGVFQFADLQIEAQSFATPFVSGTRSATQAMLDITNQNTITAESLSYSSGTYNYPNSVTTALDVTDQALLQPSTVTISAWAYLDQYNPLNDFAGQFPTIAWRCGVGPNGDQASYGISLYAGQVPRFTITPTALISGIVMPTGTWFNLVGVYNASGGMYMYRNGALETSTTGPVSITYNPQPFAVGNRIWSGTYQYPWNGNISTVQLYNRALSSDEVLQNFNALRGRYGL